MPKSKEETVKLFSVLESEMIIDFRDGQVRLSKDEMFIVPKGVEIKPSADKECHIMLMEPGSEVVIPNLSPIAPN
ncbi:disulfide bond formation protein DsbA [Paenibacillus sp. 1781tsa1]|uniref:disulfide bond formation protein DsbA n=1 Tax=Paenibacillus sp. 1781tsa1 TaxID=2953810 RepID=UPI00209D868F|nr:disulfide bond formation protein DsbA [Paenibacillus sp. 1781tsa1]MCP1184394.1 disulfide bond formation protein DsbA [Paenibacillus sp. 1781tsa1]